MLVSRKLCLFGLLYEIVIIEMFLTHLDLQRQYAKPH